MADRARIQEQMQRFIRAQQDEICRALEAVDGRGEFQEDAWQRSGGGGGLTRILEGGAVFEKAGVNTSAVWGELPEAFAKRLQGEGTSFFAAGLSLVIHPRSPLVPTVHSNVRFITQGGVSWFGGGSDLTPWYLFDEDAAHFHRTLKETCERFQPGLYPRLKKTCDAYFRLPHRGESRGVGGIFFEKLEVGLERELSFVEDVARSFLPGYLPIVERRKGLPFTEAQRTWQEIRRGRYVEFNLLYDRGTLFGLETGGRTESILMSLPPRVRWVYDHQPEPGSEEARLCEVLRNPREWV